jgi:hypothetical protein
VVAVAGLAGLADNRPTFWAPEADSLIVLGGSQAQGTSPWRKPQRRLHQVSVNSETGQMTDVERQAMWTQA